ncbi:MAG: iron-containing alcohol dehydrogenase [Shinella zoogloeoides]|uniref:iron-containing alcohol dehydrogenase n=1 Tax=Shinella zoogloeoides TaxID=352475 RepID=UPI003C73BF16
MSLITYLNRVHFADDILEEALAVEARSLAIRRPLIVTDRGLAASGHLDRLLDAFDTETAPAIFAETPANPTEAACRAAAAAYRNHDCDSLIGFGGGSSIDLAKAVALAVSHDGPLISYAAVEGGVSRIQNILPPIIAIPTTAGTGSEVGRGALIVFDDGRKLGLISPYLIPKVAICDPTLTLTLPPELTAATGMDAITHCVETYIATAYNPPADGIALDGLRRAAANIERAVEEGRDLDSRREMMAAALNGALAFQKGLGGVHAMSHALGGLKQPNLHHGTLNAVLLPHVLAFNAPAAGHRYPALREAIGVPAGRDLAAAFSRISNGLGLPSRLGEMGLDRSALELAAALAERDHTNGTNPRRATSRDYLAMLTDAL